YCVGAGVETSSDEGVAFSTAGVSVRAGFGLTSFFIIAPDGEASMVGAVVTLGALVGLGVGETLGATDLVLFMFVYVNVSRVPPMRPRTKMRIQRSGPLMPLPDF